MKTAAFYIPLHTDLVRHRKVYALAHALRIHRASVVLILLELWTWATLHAQDGVIRLTPRDLVLNLGVSDLLHPDHEFFVAQLIHHRWLDIDPVNGNLVIHEWDLYAGRSLRRRSEEAARSAGRREAEGSRRQTKLAKQAGRMATLRGKKKMAQVIQMKPKA